jgi:hypothetical protein
MMKPADLIDALAQGLERVYPSVVFGRLNPGNNGFRAQLPEGTLYIVTVREAGFRDAPMMDEDSADWLHDPRSHDKEASMADVEFNWDAPMMDEDSADWLHGMSWGGFPENGDDFMEYLGWHDLPRTEQRAAAKEFMTYGRARHMPAAVKDHLVALGLFDEEPSDVKQ